MDFQQIKLKHELEKYIDNEIKNVFKQKITIMVTEDDILSTFLNDRGKYLEDKIKNDTIELITNTSKKCITEFLRENIQNMFTIYVKEDKWVQSFISTHMEQIKEITQEKIKEIVDSDEKTSPIIKTQIDIIKERNSQEIKTLIDKIDEQNQEKNNKNIDVLKKDMHRIFSHVDNLGYYLTAISIPGIISLGFIGIFLGLAYSDSRSRSR